MRSLADLNVILASSSPRRRDLLNLIGVVHEVRAANIDEAYRKGEKPAAHAERLAREKVEKIAADNRGSIVIGADTIVVAGKEVLGKPRDQADATRMLKMLSGETHVVMTAIAASLRGGTVSAVEKVSVTFRDLRNDEIASYIDTGEPMDKAGAYGIQGYGATIVTRVEGDYFAVMGLSLVRVVDLMAQLGVRYGFVR